MVCGVLIREWWEPFPKSKYFKTNINSDTLNGVSCNPDWFPTPYEGEDDLEFLILPPPPSKYRDYKYYVVLKIGPCFYAW